MDIAQIGPWEFEVPQGWCLTSGDAPMSCFESADQKKRLYVKAVEVQEPSTSARRLAEHIQDVHFLGFCAGVENAWEIVDQQSSLEGDFAHSTLDMYDDMARCRVLSFVLATTSEAILLSMHDYGCDDHDALRSVFSDVAGSIVKLASAG